MSATLLSVQPDPALGNAPVHNLRTQGQDCYLNPNGTISVGAGGGAGGAPLIAGVWRALLTQASTSAPTAVVLENSIGATITLARSSTGVYTITAGTAVFTANKTYVQMPSILSYGSNLANTASYAKTSTTVVTVSTAVGSYAGGTNTLTDALLSATEITIIVYA